MSSNPSVDERRIQVLEALSARIQHLDEIVRELKGDSGRNGQRIDEIRNILAEMKGANLNEQIRDNRSAIDGQEKRIRTLEDFRSNLTGRLLVIGFLATLTAGVLSAVIVKLLTR